MSLKETLENEKRHESDLQYKMSHQFTYIYLGISGVLVAAFLTAFSIAASLPREPLKKAASTSTVSFSPTNS